MTTFPVIIDGHNDTLLSLYMPDRGKGRTFFVRSETGHLDLPRARQGGFGGGFFAMFVPAAKGRNESVSSNAAANDNGRLPAIEPAIDQAYAQEVTDDLIALLSRLERESEGALKVVRTTSEMTACMEQGVLAAIIHFEDAAAIAPDLHNLSDYYESGLRSLGITWSRPNAFGNGVPFDFPRSPDTGPGLTRAGRELVRACNQMGIMIDLSHLNEKGFWDVARLSEAPLVATHSGVHVLCRSTRNLKNRQLDAIGESGGVVGINFHVGFLRADGRQEPDTPLSEIVRHANYIVQRIGIDHVALGSDFDGATMPEELGDASGLPKLVAAFREAGYDDEAMRRVAHDNWIRVLAHTWKE